MRSLICSTTILILTPGFAVLQAQEGALPPASLAETEGSGQTQSPQLTVSLARDFLQSALIPVPDRESRKRLQRPVLEAQVAGWQIAHSTTGLRLEPNRSNLELTIVVNGSICSETTGVTSQATIDSIGRHTFEMKKKVIFDGERFLTARPYGLVTATQEPRSVRTRFSGTPILGDIADRIAWREVRRRRIETVNAVAEWVAEDVIEDVDRQVDEGLAELNRQWRQWQTEAAATIPVFEGHWSSASTSDGVVLIHSLDEATPDVHDLKDSALVEIQSSGSDIVVVMNEAYAGRLATTEQLAGLTMDADEIGSLVASLIEPNSFPAESAIVENDADTDADSSSMTLTIPVSPQWPLPGEDSDTDRGDEEGPDTTERIVARPIPQTGSALAGWKVRFDAIDPLDIRFESGRMLVRVRAEIVPPFGVATPMQDVEVALRSRNLNEDHWTLDPEDVIVRDTATGESTGMIRELIRNQVLKMIQAAPQLSLPRVLEVQVADDAPATLLRVHRIRTNAGELVTEFRRQSSGSTFESGVAEE